MAQSERDAQELLRKAQIEKFKTFGRKQIKASLFQQLIIAKAATNYNNYEDGKERKSNEEMVREAMDICKWAEIVWFEEFPESDEDYETIGFIPGGGPVRGY